MIGDLIVHDLRLRAAGLAQLVERQFCKLDVAGSIPATGTILYCARQTPLNHPQSQILRHDGKIAVVMQQGVVVG